MSVKPVLELKAVEVAQGLEGQGMAEEDGAEEDAFSKPHANIRTAAISST